VPIKVKQINIKFFLDTWGYSNRAITALIIIYHHLLRIYFYVFIHLLTNREQLQNCD